MLLATASHTTVPYANNLHGGTSNSSSSSSSSNSSNGSSTNSAVLARKKLTTINKSFGGSTQAAHSSSGNNKGINNQHQLQPRASLLVQPQQQNYRSNRSENKEQVVTANSIRSSTSLKAVSAIATANNVASTFMKTLSVRLHRGTEFIKDTVQKALIVSASTALSSASSSNSESNCSSRSNSTDGDSGRRLASKVDIEVGLNSTNFSGCSSALATTQSSIQRAKLEDTVHAKLQAAATAVNSATFNKLYTIPPTALHRSHVTRQQVSSTDSLLTEMCHFKPIEPMPITPNKSGSRNIKSPQLINPNIVRAALELYSDEEKSKQVIKSKLKTNNLLNASRRYSAFVPLFDNANMALYRSTPENPRRGRKPIKKTKTAANKRRATPAPSVDETQNDEVSVTTKSKNTNTRKRKSQASVYAKQPNTKAKRKRTNNKKTEEDCPAEEIEAIKSTKTRRNVTVNVQATKCTRKRNSAPAVKETQNDTNTNDTNKKKRGRPSKTSVKAEPKNKVANIESYSPPMTRLRALRQAK